MKKFLTLCLAICLMSSLLLTSCVGDKKSNKTDDTEKQTETIQQTQAEEVITEPQNATELFERISLGEYDVYEYDISSNMVFYTDGYKFVSAGTGKDIYEKTDNSLYSYNMIEFKTKCEDLEVVSVSQSMEMYSDGFAYMSEIIDDKEQMLCSEMSAEEYEAYLSDINIPELGISDCTNNEFEKLDDGGWKLVLSGFTKKAINPFLKYADLDNEAMGADVIDIQFELVVDKDYMPKYEVVSLVFDVEETDTAVPEFTIRLDYVSIGFIKSEKPQVNKNGYKLVDDIRVITLISDELDALADAASGSFTVSLQQIFRMGEQISTYSETDEISFGKMNGAFYYDITGLSNFEPRNISYKNGVRTVTQGGAVETEACTEEEAKEYIRLLINSPGYDKAYVTDIKEIANNKYSIVLVFPEENGYADLYESLSGECTSVSVSIVATFDDNNKLVKLESDAKIAGQIKGETGILALISAVEYETGTNTEIDV